MKIDGLPEGYELLRIGKPLKDELLIDGLGKVIVSDGCQHAGCAIVREIPEPLQLREGAWYERRDGKIVGPCKKDTDGKSHPDSKWIVTPCWYRDDGTNTNGGFALIREVPAPKPAIDPGEGWRLLEKDEKVIEGDEYFYFENWVPSENWRTIGEQGSRVGAYRRRIAPKYRPFRNAAEFMPHRDKWIHQKSGERGLITSYSDLGVWHNGRKASWQEFFDNYCFDEDGTPCGVKE